MRVGTLAIVSPTLLSTGRLPWTRFLKFLPGCTVAGWNLEVSGMASCFANLLSLSLVGGVCVVAAVVTGNFSGRGDRLDFLLIGVCRHHV